jgi:hypothetical protein
MPEAGIKFSYNYNIAGRSQRKYGLANARIFRWENGVVEIPVSYISQLPAEPVQFNDSTYLQNQNPQDAYDLISQFQSEWHSSNVLIMMMHSWSFLYLNQGSDYFEYKDSEKAELFDRFLASLPQQVKVVTATELAKLLAQGVLSVPDRMSTAEVLKP